MLTTPVCSRRRWTAFAAGMLLFGGLSQAAAQFVAPGGSAERNQQGFPAPPSQNAAFPPPPGQAREFPAPGAQPQSFPAPGAQSGAFAPSRGTGSGGSFVAPGGGMGGTPPQVPQVCSQFGALGKDMEESLVAVNEAGKRKATREEVCPLFKTLSARETKALRFLETNKATCQIPQNFIKQLSERHSHIVKVTKVVCSAGPPPGAAGPSLSDALGGPTIADDASAAKPGRGTFDTLTGNALQRN